MLFYFEGQFLGHYRFICDFVDIYNLLSTRDQVMGETGEKKKKKKKKTRGHMAEVKRPQTFFQDGDYTTTRQMTRDVQTVPHSVD